MILKLQADGCIKYYIEKEQKPHTHLGLSLLKIALYYSERKGERNLLWPMVELARTRNDGRALYLWAHSSPLIAIGFFEV